MNNKFNLLILLFLMIIYYICSSKEKFTHHNKLEYNKIKYNVLDIDEKTGEILKKSINNPIMKRTIKKKMVSIYQEILQNEKLKEFLLFNNLINKQGLPAFINECEEVVLSNEIKIILLTSPNYFINI